MKQFSIEVTEDNRTGFLEQCTYHAGEIRLFSGTVMTQERCNAIQRKLAELDDGEAGPRVGLLADVHQYSTDGLSTMSEPVLEQALLRVRRAKYRKKPKVCTEDDVQRFLDNMTSEQERDLFLPLIKKCAELMKIEIDGLGER